MILKHWAKKQGISYQTALRWFHSGKLPVGATQTETGTILVYDEKTVTDTKKYILYARVSSHDQKNDLERQIQRLRDYCAATGIPIYKEVAEIGSGLNGQRAKLLSILSNRNYNIVVEHKDRLTRFGFTYISTVLESDGRRITVINETENKNDLVQDFIDVVTSMCARIYGRRSAKNRAEKAIKAANDED